MIVPLDPWLTVLAALALAAVSGANDGASMLSLALSGREVPPLLGLGVLVVALVTVPLVLGITVAATLVDGLVAFGPVTRPVAIPIALLLAVAVAGALAHRGLPTSLTLALVGSIVGLGVGLGAAVHWPVVGRALTIAAAAPFVAAGLANLLHRLSARLPLRASARRRRWTGVAALVAQAVAYGANDGQKVIAVLLLASVAGAGAGVARGTLDADVRLVALGGVFALGTLWGLRAVVRRLGRGILSVRPGDALTAQFAASIAVLGTAAWGAPVSMTQSSAAALVGSGLTRGSGRIRWTTAARLAGSWALTLPTAVALGAGAALAWRALA